MLDRLVHQAEEHLAPRLPDPKPRAEVDVLGRDVLAADRLHLDVPERRGPPERLVEVLGRDADRERARALPRPRVLHVPAVGLRGVDRIAEARSNASRGTTRTSSAVRITRESSGCPTSPETWSPGRRGLRHHAEVVARSQHRQRRRPWHPWRPRRPRRHQRRSRSSPSDAVGPHDRADQTRGDEHRDPGRDETARQRAPGARRPDTAAALACRGGEEVSVNQVQVADRRFHRSLSSSVGASVSSASSCVAMRFSPRLTRARAVCSVHRERLRDLPVASVRRSPAA